MDRPQPAVQTPLVEQPPRQLPRKRKAEDLAAPSSHVHRAPPLPDYERPIKRVSYPEPPSPPPPLKPASSRGKPDATETKPPAVSSPARKPAPAPLANVQAAPPRSPTTPASPGMPRHARKHSAGSATSDLKSPTVVPSLIERLRASRDKMPEPNRKSWFITPTATEEQAREARQYQDRRHQERKQLGYALPTPPPTAGFAIALPTPSMASSWLSDHLDKPLEPSDPPGPRPTYSIPPKLVHFLERERAAVCEDNLLPRLPGEPPVSRLTQDFVAFMLEANRRAKNDERVIADLIDFNDAIPLFFDKALGEVLYEQETGLKQIAEAACVGSNTRMADVFGIESLIRFLYIPQVCFPDSLPAGDVALLSSLLHNFACWLSNHPALRMPHETYLPAATTSAPPTPALTPLREESASQEAPVVVIKPPVVQHNEYDTHQFYDSSRVIYYEREL